MLLEIAKRKHPKATIIHADGTRLPYADNSFDAVISIAVIHHLPLVALRNMFVEEIYRVLRPGGKALVTAWATESLKNTWYHIGNNDYIVPWKSKKEKSYDRFYHLYTKQEAETMFGNILMTHENGDPPVTVDFECNNWYVTLVK